ncbi:putative C6 transcription factor [Aspergillus lucknowensis]|uniref:Fungal-specific transcription factor domain-containing protein n=1 Tax=Aspergillus lucknowensis TaxID=176173 RepID=A0ABR4LF41_9EURO
MSEGRRTHRRSCFLCRSRKVKCDRQQPCGACVRAASNCVYPSGTGRAPKRPRQSVNNSAVLSRLGRLESIIRQLEGQHAQQPRQPALEPSTAGPSTQGDQRNGRLAIDSTSSVYVSNVLWASLGDEVEELRDLLHEPSSNDDDDGDGDEGEWQEETDEKEEPLGSPGLNAAIMGFRSLAHSLRAYHPPLAQQVALFEIFQTNVIPMVKIFHTPTLTQLFWNTVASLDALDCNAEALLFAIYYAAIISTDQNQCPVGINRLQALHTYRFAVEQALARADLLNTQNTVLLQAAALFLSALRSEDDSRTVWSLTALIVHIAQAMGLHRDGAAFGLLPLETELRRRLWWFIVGLDQRSSEYHGYEPIVSEASFDTRLPLNVNDSDLTADMVHPPTERDGPTEMTLSLIGWEAISIVRKVSFIPPHCRQARTTTSNSSLAELSLPEREALAQELQTRLETRYLQYCNPADPFLFVSSTVAKLIIARVWLMVHYPRKQADSSKEIAPASPQASLQDRIFPLSIELLELSCSLLCNGSVAHWAWRFDTYLQWHAVALVLSEICTRPPCRDCDRAWAAVEFLYDRWRMKEHTRKGTLWKPIGRLMAKARYVREMQSVDRGCSSSAVEANPNAPFVASHNNVTTTLNPLADIFSLAPFMELSPGLDDVFPVDDDFVQVGMRAGS